MIQMIPPITTVRGYYVSISVCIGKDGVVMRVGKFSDIGCVSWRWQTMDLFISAVAGRILATTRNLRFISFVRYVSYKCRDFWMEVSSTHGTRNIGPRKSWRIFLPTQTARQATSLRCWVTLSLARVTLSCQWGGVTTLRVVNPHGGGSRK